MANQRNQDRGRQQGDQNNPGKQRGRQGNRGNQDMENNRDASMNEDQQQDVSRQQGNTGQDDTGLGRQRSSDQSSIRENERNSGTGQNLDEENESSTGY